MISSSVSPVLWRELLVQARTRGTPWLRVLGGAFALGMLMLALANDTQLLAISGQSAFIGLNKLIVVFIWIAAPIITADCLSREKREGTMGLLFLTPLSPFQVVIAKVFAHALRTFTIVATAYPVLVLPLLFGGVTWQDAARVALLQGASLTFALAAGVAASAVTEGWLAARLLALAFAVVSAVGFVSCYLGAISWHNWYHIAWLRQRSSVWEVFLQQWNAFTFQVGLHGGGFWWFWHGSPSWTKANDRVLTTAMAFVGTLVLSAFVMRFAASGLAKTWRPVPASEGWALRWSKFRHLLVRLAGRHPKLLDRHPVEWLQRWHTGFWLGPLGCCALACLPLAYIWLAHASATPILLADFAFSAGIAFTAANSFRAERSAGFLESLLVTPVKAEALAKARFLSMLGLWLPAIVIFAFGVLNIQWRWVVTPGSGFSSVTNLNQALQMSACDLVLRLAVPFATIGLGVFLASRRISISLAMAGCMAISLIVALTKVAFEATKLGWLPLLSIALAETLILAGLSRFWLECAGRHLANRR
ncbi:MAG TPA: hypothetical protein VMF06_07990 [Candidatus Limnocylindria bacterium]|jgi:ABC-type transport system involved in cytochrome c biogenesis permease component|nr:hypothetical protein [Candidatus Limnocylindria bacterium]